jgi:predicted metal-dependent HD superfamily phosphohydrolase
LYFAVSLCTEQVNPATELVSDMRVVELAVKNINGIYKTIKKSEESPGTDYLFSGLDKKVAMAKQMEMVNSVVLPKMGPSSGGGINKEKIHIYNANAV